MSTLGWAVVHSLWQWTVIAGCVAALLGLMRRSRPERRYLVSCLGLIAMLLTSIGTMAVAREPWELALRQRVLYAFDGRFIVQEIVSSGFTILRVAAVLWWVGVVTLTVRVALQCRALVRLRRDGLSEAGDAVRQTVDRLVRQMSIRRRVEVWCSAQATVPMVVGWRRPMILLPAAALGRLTPDQLAAVLAHELGHVRRADFVANVLQVVADVAGVLHPAAWWVSRRVRTEREYCCDDIAVATTRDAASYARALATLEDARGEYRFAVAAASGTLLDRIQRVVGRPVHSLTPGRGVIILVAALFVSAALIAVTVSVPPPGTPAGVKMRRPAQR